MAAAIYEGYARGSGGYYRTVDGSGPYAFNAAGVPTLLGTTTAAVAAGNASGAAITALAATTGPATIGNLLPANPARKGKPAIYFDGAAIAYVALGPAASASLFTVKLGQGLLTYYEPPANYTGPVSVFFSAAAGTIYATEMT